MQTIDRNNYGKSSTRETTYVNENNASLCFIEIAIQMLDYLNRYQTEILGKRISWSIF
jgi:hypothetical protein